MSKIILFDQWMMWLVIQWESKWFIKLFIILIFSAILVMSIIFVFLGLFGIGAIKGNPELWKKIKKLRKKQPVNREKLYKAYKKYYGF